MKDQNVSIFNEIKKKNEIKVFISPDTKNRKY